MRDGLRLLERVDGAYQVIYHLFTTNTFIHELPLESDEPLSDVWNEIDGSMSSLYIME